MHSMLYCVLKEREQTKASRIVTRINREQTNNTKLVFKSVRCSVSAAVASCSSVCTDALVIVVYFCDCAKMGFASGVVKYLVFLANLVFAVSKTIPLKLRLVFDFLTHFLIFLLLLFGNNGKRFLWWSHHQGSPWKSCAGRLIIVFFVEW